MSVAPDTAGSRVSANMSRAVSSRSLFWCADPFFGLRTKALPSCRFPYLPIGREDGMVPIKEESTLLFRFDLKLEAKGPQCYPDNESLGVGESDPTCPLPTLVAHDSTGCGSGFITVQPTCPPNGVVGLARGGAKRRAGQVDIMPARMAGIASLKYPQRVVDL